MKRKAIFAAMLLISIITMAQTNLTTNNTPAQVTEPTPGLGVRKPITRRSEVPVISMPGDIINVSFQAQSDETLVYITDGNDIYFEAGLSVDKSTNLPVPTYCLPKGDYFVVVEDQSNFVYQEFTVR